MDRTAVSLSSSTPPTQFYVEQYSSVLTDRSGNPVSPCLFLPIGRDTSPLATSLKFTDRSGRALRQFSDVLDPQLQLWYKGVWIIQSTVTGDAAWPH